MITYLALGDSISIDTYTGVVGGGAVNQFARLIGATETIDLTYDGCVTTGVLSKLAEAPSKVDVITLTVGGNDLLSGFFFRQAGDRGLAVGPEKLIDNLTDIFDRLAAYRCPVIVNTIYDPTDGKDERAAELGLPPVEGRAVLQVVNLFVPRLARKREFLLCDLEALFHGHGFWSDDPWMVMHIEPNLEGATQIARAWHNLYSEKLFPAPRSG